MKKFLIILLSAFILSVSVYSQDASRITEILKTEKVSYGQAAYLAASYVGVITEKTSYANALEVLASKGLVSKDVKANDPISLSDFSYLCAKVTQLKGGLMFTLFDNPRYALKELKAKGIIAPNADPDFTVNGHEALSVLSNCIEATGAN